MTSYEEDNCVTTIYNKQNQHEYDYKPKLLGILPQDFLYRNPTRWNTADLYLCKPPSQQHWMCGSLVGFGHPSLTGTAILEKKSNSKDVISQQQQQHDRQDDKKSEKKSSLPQLESKLANLFTADTTTATTPIQTQTHPNLLDCVFQYSSPSSYGLQTERSPISSVSSSTNAAAYYFENDGGISTESEEVIKKNIWNSGSAAMKFLKNNFQPETESLPDFTCNRNVLVNLMTESKNFVIQATKQKFNSRTDSSQKEFSTIELFFRPIQFDDVSSKAGRIASAIQSQQQLPYQSGPNQNDPSSTRHADNKDVNWRSRAHHHHGINFHRLRSQRHHNNNNFKEFNYENGEKDEQPHYGHGDGNGNRRNELSSRPFTAEEFALYQPSTLRLENPVSNMFNRSWDSVQEFITSDLDNTESSSTSNLDIEDSEGESTGEGHAESPELPETSYLAFVQGKLTRINRDRQELRQSFTFLIGSYLDGVWTVKRNPHNYTCTDLAEIKTAKSTTVQGVGVGRDFYKQVRMAQNWSQTYLAGLKHYMVGVTVPSTTEEGEDTIDELLLYSVEKIPEFVQHTSELNDFKAWTPEELKTRLFSFLSRISTTMASQPFDVPINFFHYDGESFLTTMSNAEVHDEIKCLQEVRKRVVLKGLQPPPPMAIEERQNAFNEAQIKTILHHVKWPIKQFGRPTVKRFNREVHLTFESELVACAFARLVKNMWRQKTNIPPLFEKLWVEMKPPLTRRHDHAIVVNKRGASGMNIEPTGDCLNNNIQNPLVVTSRFTNYQKSDEGLLGEAPSSTNSTLTTGLYPRSMWSRNNFEASWRQ